MPCRLRGNLKKTLTYTSVGGRRRVERAKKRQETDPASVGDRVEIEVDEEGRSGVIVTVLPRRSVLARRSGNERERQTLVANLDLAVVVFAAAEPRVDPWKLDRFLVLTEEAEVRVLIVLNKADRADPSDIEPLAESYRALGYDVLLTSARAEVGIDVLKARLKGIHFRVSGTVRRRQIDPPQRDSARSQTANRRGRRCQISRPPHDRPG